MKRAIRAPNAPDDPTAIIVCPRHHFRFAHVLDPLQLTSSGFACHCTVPHWKTREQQIVSRHAFADYQFWPKEKDSTGKWIIVRADLEDHITVSCFSTLALSAQRQSSSAPPRYSIVCTHRQASRSSTRPFSPSPELYACCFLARFYTATCCARLVDQRSPLSLLVTRPICSLLSCNQSFGVSIVVDMPRQRLTKAIPLPKCRMIRHNSPNDSAFIGRLRGKRPD